MKLILEDGETRVELKEIETLNMDSEILFFFLNTHLRQEHIEVIETNLSNKTGKKCIVLDNLYTSKIIGI